MKERLMEILDAFSTPLCNGMSAKLPERERLAEHLAASGVIVPPCKVWDTVYELQPIRARTQAYEITTVKWNGHYWWFTWVVKDRNGIYGNVDGFSSHQIGKTVFLTREEAEKALAEREGKG